MSNSNAKENENDNDVIIERISNFEYDAYYAIIKKGKLDTTYLKIRTLIKSINDYNKNKVFHLKINSFEYINEANLAIKEKESTLLNFNNTFKKINLIYDLDDKFIYSYPISISFFIKERVKFKINISNNKDEILIKIVAYQDKILIEPNFIPKKISKYNYFNRKN